MFSASSLVEIVKRRGKRISKIQTVLVTKARTQHRNVETLDKLSTCGYVAYGISFRDLLCTMNAHVAQCSPILR